MKKFQFKWRMKLLTFMLTFTVVTTRFFGQELWDKNGGESEAWLQKINIVIISYI